MDLYAPLLFGLLLGLKHSLEPDHLVAVTGIISQQKHPLQFLKVGFAWGIGHTMMLLTVGALVLVLKISISESLSAVLESIVGCMIILLSIQSLRGRWLHHHHSHTHENITMQSTTARIYLRSLFVGMVHGLAGAGALTVLVLSTVKSIPLGIMYMLVFGIGSIISMSFAGLLIGLPFAVAHQRAHQIEHLLVTGCAVLGILFGIYYLYESLRFLTLL